MARQPAFQIIGTPGITQAPGVNPNLAIPPAGGTQVGPINFPALQSPNTPSFAETLANLFQGLQNQRPSSIEVNPLLPQFQEQITQSTKPISGLNDEYFGNIQKQATERLKEEYFNPGGIEEQVAEQAASRGLVGSGVEQAIRKSQVIDPFQKGATDIANQVTQLQAQHGVDIEKFNRELGLRGQEMMTNLALADRATGLEAEVANRQIDLQFNSLVTKLADAEQGRLTAAEQADLDRQIRQMQLAATAYFDWQNSRLNQANLLAKIFGTPLDELTDSQRQMLEQLAANFNLSGGGGEGEFNIDLSIPGPSSPPPIGLPPGGQAQPSPGSTGGGYGGPVGGPIFWV